jgi:hypothetical protein
MAEGINIKVLPQATSVSKGDRILLDKNVLGTQVILFSAVVVDGSQVTFYNDFLNLSANTTTFISGGISPSGSIVPSKVGILYFSSNTKDYFVSVDNVSVNDWKRILTVDY